MLFCGDRRAVDPLIEALADPDAGVCKAAAAALKAITEQDFGQDAGRWRAWWAENAPPQSAPSEAKGAGG